MFEAPYLPYDPLDKSGYETVVKRWPVILTGIIDTVYRTNHDSSIEDLNVVDASDDQIPKNEARITEGKVLIENFSRLKYQMGRDRPLEPVPEDGEPMVDIYNAELARLEKDGKNTWFTAPWLFAECYLYRFIRAYFAQTKHWRAFDPFYAQKEATFQASGTAIHQLATTMHELEEEKSALESDPDKLQVLFKEMIQMCLWCDLSLLTHMTHEDIQHLQSVGKEAQQARQEFILKDDQNAVWEHVKTLKDARVDFVLDNAGFELYTDLVFADFLVTYTPYVSHVTFHPKLIPWFVSDVTPPDFAATLTALLSPTFFPPPPASSTPPSTDASPSPSPSPSSAHLHALVARWTAYFASGVFALSVPRDAPLGARSALAEFWTSPWPYWDMRAHAPALWGELRGSGLVVFKVRARYRKLTGDVQWPVSTPFSTATGESVCPLAGAFPLLSLRTNKADVAVGIPEAIAAALDARGEKWRTSGRCVFLFYVRVLVGPGLWLADGPLVACVQVRAGVLLACGRTASVNLWISWMPELGRASKCFWSGRVERNALAAQDTYICVYRQALSERAPVQPHLRHRGRVGSAASGYLRECAGPVWAKVCGTYGKLQADTPRRSIAE
ncbi:hypothetical protein HETIRDRAFT_309837 [Heterobasidion irregulare TC 32-1]|uniref:Damage-control phosphatase ARMT1-like metal-binding domain-containing protein n=1 Tax=Heterobasidion irregulare (strain TC 32-1) TaxID=747525 RepID=W4KLE3_HETIT|nr:uncharacterized protein HETIRDRAFT_309837 [Heterobasidion irregulare TC 32-1]ETW85861.1 hypothetical protein HETIRDRAFT_309837 [Heterobasidion irregulare TC 32-1]